MKRMMKHSLRLSTALLLIATSIAMSLVGCQPDEKEQPAVPQECTFTLKHPLSTPDATYSNRVVTLKSDKDGKEIKLQPTEDTFKQGLLEGSYQLTFAADISYQSAKLGKVETSVSLSEKIEVTKGKTTFTLTPQYSETTSGFVIEEISFSPSVDPANPKKKYKYVEQYLKITNNSDITLYADGLGIVESADKTTNKKEYKNSIFDHAMSVDFLYLIPGDGTTYPVKPGESIIIANDAKDHSKDFPGATDLSGANFEIYDISSNPKVQDTDNLEVPNLIPYYKASLTVHSFNQQGNTTIALARVPVTADEYTRDYAWEGKYDFVKGSFTKEMTNKCYQIPHTWLIDVVNLSIKDGKEWLFVPASLDAGFTGWRDTAKETLTNEMAVRRKIDREQVTRKYLKDTNNSTVDFDRRVLPSLKQNNRQ